MTAAWQADGPHVITAAAEPLDRNFLQLTYTYRVDGDVIAILVGRYRD